MEPEALRTKIQNKATKTRNGGYLHYLHAQQHISIASFHNYLPFSPSPSSLRVVNSKQSLHRIAHHLPSSSDKP
jgi:hypothetical protein